jgi:DNA helicase HerA-like ATPase
VELIATVDGERLREDASASKDYRRATDPVERELEVSLIGYLEGGEFKRGVREMPLLDNECFILDEPEFKAIHTFGPDDATAIPLGTLSLEPTQPVRIGADAIFASHVGIFGSTGSGKSYTLAKLYHELFSTYAAAPGFRDRSQFILIDFNGEYVDREATQNEDSSTSVITASNKREFKLSTRVDSGARLPLPASAITDPIFWTVLLDATEKTQAPFLARVLESDYWDKKLQSPDDLMAVLADMVLRATKSSDIAIDRRLVFNLFEEIQTCLGAARSESLDELVRDFSQNLNYNPTQRSFYWGEWAAPYVKPDSDDWEKHTSDKVKALEIDFSHITAGIDLVRFKIVLQYYSDIISGYSNREHLSPLIKRMETRVPDIKKLIEASDEDQYDEPLIVVSLRDVNLAMRKVVPMLLCKHLYDRKKELDPGNTKLLNLIVDEAHNILSMESTRESEAWRDYRLETFEEIIKEGRKFGVFLTIASQRPHDISATIISQLHNYFLHRLVNDLDIKAVEKAVSYLDRVSFESLPILPTGVCILAGVAAQIPVMVKVGELAAPFEPNSRTMSVVKAWNTPVTPGEAESDEEDPFAF